MQKLSVNSHRGQCLQANEAAYQAWYAASVIAEFGVSRVYREVRLMRTQLAELVSPETLVGRVRLRP